jgi:hypothetical protein
MWALIQSLLTKWALVKVILRALASLGWLVPIAFVLKAVGLPLLIMIAVLGLPIFIVLALFGLPILLVLCVGALLLVGIFVVLSLGVAALKIALPVLIVVWLVRWFLGKGTKDEGADPASP